MKRGPQKSADFWGEDVPLSKSPDFGNSGHAIATRKAERKRTPSGCGEPQENAEKAKLLRDSAEASKKADSDEKVKNGKRKAEKVEIAP